MKWLSSLIFSFLIGTNAFALPQVNYETCIKFSKDFSNLTKGNEYLITEDTAGNQKGSEYLLKTGGLISKELLAVCENRKKGADINKLAGELFNKCTVECDKNSIKLSDKEKRVPMAICQNACTRATDNMIAFMQGIKYAEQEKSAADCSGAITSSKRGSVKAVSDDMKAIRENVEAIAK
jgi:hypothetical protein